MRVKHSNKYQFGLNSIDEKGLFSGYASVFNVLDHHGDIIMPGAFKNLVCNEIKLLWQHKFDEPIGRVLSIEEDDKGMFVVCQLAMGISRGEEAYNLLKNKVIDGLSIGYSVIEEVLGEKGCANIIYSLKLWEISLVTFPSNHLSRVHYIKSSNSNCDNSVAQLRSIIRSIENLTNVLK